MAVSTMTRRVIPPYNNERYEYDQTLTYVAAELTSNPIIMVGGDNILTVCLVLAASSSGKVQTTNNSYDEVIADPDTCDWVDWDSGTVTSTTQDTLEGSITAYRFICTTGTVTIRASAQ